jgi:hypothetical protein
VGVAEQFSPPFAAPSAGVKGRDINAQRRVHYMPNASCAQPIRLAPTGHERGVERREQRPHYSS